MRPSRKNIGWSCSLKKLMEWVHVAHTAIHLCCNSPLPPRPLGVIGVASHQGVAVAAVDRMLAAEKYLIIGVVHGSSGFSTGGLSTQLLFFRSSDANECKIGMAKALTVGNRCRSFAFY